MQGRKLKFRWGSAAATVVIYGSVVRRENIKHFRELLKAATDDAERERIQKLLDEELKKQKDAGDKIED